MEIKKQILKEDEKFLERFVKVKEAADILGQSRPAVYKKIYDGKLDIIYLCKGTKAEERLFYRKQVAALRLVMDGK